MEMCLAFEYESLSVPAPLPDWMHGYLDIGMAGCLGVCVPVRVVQSKKGPVSALAPAVSVSLCLSQTRSGHAPRAAASPVLSASLSLCLSWSALAVRRGRSSLWVAWDGETDRRKRPREGLRETHPEACASVRDTSEAVLTVASIDPLCVRPSQ